MPEIIRCRECDRETYMGLAACPHCGANIPPDLAPDLAVAKASNKDYGGQGISVFAMFAVRLFIFNFSYYATISIIEIYDKYEYGEQAMPGGAHPAAAMFIISAFFVLNFIYLMIELLCWALFKKMKPVISIVFPVVSYFAIVLCFVVFSVLKN